MTAVTGILNVAVPVSDQDRALAFYVDVLGLEKRMDAELGGRMRWIEVAPPNSATSIALAAGAPGVDTGIRLTVRDAAAEHAALRSAGVAVEELLLWEGVPPMFVLADPDGNRLYVVQEAQR